MESSVANGEPGPFFFPSGNLTFEAEWFCMVLFLPILAIEPTKTTKKDVWLPLWHRVGHSHLDPSMKSQPCCTSGKIPNALNRSSSLLIPFFINFKEPFVLGGDCLHCRNKWAHVFKSQCYQISQIFFPHLVWKPTMAAFLYPGSLCLHVVENSNRKIVSILLTDFYKLYADWDRAGGKTRAWVTWENQIKIK